MLKLLRIPDLRIALCALMVSMIGDSMMLTIPAVLVRSVSGSNVAAGFEVFFFTIPICFAPATGAFVDRFRRRPFLIWACLISAVSLLPLLAITTPGYWWTGYLVAAFLGCSYVCTGAGVSGLLPQLVPGELLGHANSLLQSFRQGLRLVGPLAGLLVYERFGVGAVTGADAASFIVAAIIFAALKADEKIPSPRPRRGVADLTEGVRYLFKNGSLRAAVVAIVPFAVTCGVTGAATYAIVTAGLGKPAEFVGYLTSVMGIGAIAGGLLAARMIERLGELGTIGVGVIAYGLGSAGLAAPSVPLALVSMALAGIGVTLPVIGRLTLMQRRTPPEIMGRVSFAWDSIGTGVQLVAMAACASLLAVTDFRYVLVPAALVSVTGGIQALASRARAARSLPV